MADGAAFELTSTEEQQPWAANLEALGNAEQVLAKMMETMAGDGASPTNIKLLNFEEDDDDKTTQVRVRVWVVLIYFL